MGHKHPEDDTIQSVVLILGKHERSRCSGNEEVLRVDLTQRIVAQYSVRDSVMLASSGAIENSLSFDRGKQGSRDRHVNGLNRAPRSSYVGFPVNIPPNQSEKC